MGFSTTWLLCLNGKIAFGCKDLLNSNKPFLIKIKWRNTFTPPDVDPEDPPRNIIPKNSIVKKGVQEIKSPVTKPVVVTRATTWKRECLKLLSNFPYTSGW